MASEREYVLGTNAEELVRLGFQHRAWAQYAFALWEEAGFSAGKTILDVGCGPGFGTIDLARIVGPAGRVIAIDASDRFLEYLRGQLAAQSLAQVETRLGDVENLDLPPGSIDGAYARWVLCFVKNPSAVVSAVAKALRPGAAFAIQDYFNYAAITLAPRSEIFSRVVRAVIASWIGHGGDPDLVGRLPALMQENGLELRLIRPIMRAARPSSLLWEWPGSFFRNFVPALVRDGYLTRDDHDAFEREWARRSQDPTTFFCTPPVFDVLAVKPGR
jgi:ubiquinone/menaquinone biosynthesis C-methylase UbiE